MSSCCNHLCRVTERQFDARVAARDVRRYQRTGPEFTTRALRDAVRARAPGATLLDIGAGIGALTFELLDAGARHATMADMSAAYLAASREEASRRDRLHQVAWIQGDFVAVAPSVATADIVTLDRVVCCYPLFEPLLLRALEHARLCVAFSYPRDRWYVRGVISAENLVRGLVGNAFRTYVHSARAMHDLMRRHDFRLIDRATSVAWCADVYERDDAT